MNCKIIYEKERLDVNGFFAERLKEVFAQNGVTAEIIVAEDCRAEDINSDFCVMRCALPAFSAALAARGIKVFNDPEISRVCNDKHITLELARENNIPVMRHFLFECDFSSDPPLPFPLIAKSRFGHGGKQVFFCNDREELAAAYAAIGEKSIIIQRPASALGRDLRVYVMGGEIIAAVMRSSSSDFRSNFTLGGKISPHNLRGDEKSLVKKVISLLPDGFFGIDMLFDGGKPVLGEIEDVVGTRMLYSLKLADAAKIYAEYIIKRVECSRAHIS